MANYEKPGQALDQLVDDGKLSESFQSSLVNQLAKESNVSSQTFSSSADVANGIQKGNDIVFVEDGGNVDLSGLTKSVVKDLNALIFSTDEDVTLGLPKSFKGSVVLGGGDDIVNANGNGAMMVDGGAGDDSIVTGNGKDTVVTGNGNDIIKTNGGSDLIIVNDDAAAFDIIIDGGKGKDTLDLRNVEIDSIEDVVTNASGKKVLGATIILDSGTTLEVTGVEKVIYDVNGDGLIEKGETITLTGLLDLFPEG